jgi:hypothetical protein
MTGNKHSSTWNPKFWGSNLVFIFLVFPSPHPERERQRDRDRETERERERECGGGGEGTPQNGPKPMLSNRSPATEEHHDSNISLLLHTILSQLNPIDASYYNNTKGFTKVLECQEAEILLIFSIRHNKSLVSSQPMDTSASPEGCICQCYILKILKTQNLAVKNVQC